MRVHVFVALYVNGCCATAPVDYFPSPRRRDEVEKIEIEKVIVIQPKYSKSIK